MDIDNKVCKNFTTEDSRCNVIVQMMDNEAKNVFASELERLLPTSSSTGSHLLESEWLTAPILPTRQHMTSRKQFKKLVLMPSEIWYLELESLANVLMLSEQ